MINKKFNDFIYISLGAIIGSFLRWQIDQIFLANIIGCFFIGFLNQITIPLKFRLLFAFGLCGSLTTFSGWIFNLYRLLSKGLYLELFLNILLVFFTSFLAVYIGYLLSKKIKSLS